MWEKPKRDNEVRINFMALNEMIRFASLEVVFVLNHILILNCRKIGGKGKDECSVTGGSG